MTDQSINTQLFTTLARLAQQLGREAEAHLTGVEISMAQYRILSVLASEGPCVQKTIAEALESTAANVSQLIAKMESMSLVVREREGTRKQISWTAHGQAQWQQFTPRYEALLASQFGVLTEAERQIMLMWLQKLLDRRVS